MGGCPYGVGSSVFFLAFSFLFTVCSFVQAKASEQAMNKKVKEQGGSKKKRNDAIAAGTETAEAKALLARPKEYTVTLDFGDVEMLQPPVIQVMDVAFQYKPSLPPIFDELAFGIDMDSRICVVGNNGSGKSTLIKLLTGELNPTSGYIRRNPRLRVGVYNQHFVDKLPMDKSPVEYLRGMFDDLDYQSARNLLGKFGLEGHGHEINMRDLSGGQKARVAFCELTLIKPHVLFLGELPRGSRGTFSHAGGVVKSAWVFRADLRLLALF